jgi:cytidylate kinase
MLFKDITTPELWGFGITTLILLGGLAYGTVRAGRLSRREKARTDAATVEMQRRESMRR